MISMIRNDIIQLFVYEGIGSDTLVGAIAEIEKGINDERLSKLHRAIRDVIALAVEYGLDGNVWQGYLTYLLITHENPFSISCERTKIDPDCTLARIAKQDFDHIRKWFHYDFSKIEQSIGCDCFSLLCDYQANLSTKHTHNKNAGILIKQLCKSLASAPDTDMFYACVTEFYASHGVGQFGLCHAFSVTLMGEDAMIDPIANPARVTLDSIIGYDFQKRELVQNTKAFTQGKAANNVLLYGDSGTGKSTGVKAVLNEFAPHGLRLIEINKYQFRALSSVISQIKERNYRFIIYIDDLSFEENESEYKFLKAVIEGGVETNPENVLIYATSNRRHLIRETWSDRSDMEHNDDIHRSDTIEEKLSLAARFGVTINYSAPNRDEYLNIVKTLAKREGLEVEENTLCMEATRWELRHGGISCRTARQFIDYMHSKIDIK